MTDKFEISVLANRHDRSTFDCGDISLNNWLRQFASQNARRGIAVTYALTPLGDSRVIGFFSISCHAVTVEKIPPEHSKGLPNYAVPMILVGKFALDRHFQGQGLGRDLLVDVVRRCAELSTRVGVRGIEVDAIDEAARDFYLRYQFTSLVDNPNHLFLPIEVARTWLAKL